MKAMIIATGLILNITQAPGQNVDPRQMLLAQLHDVKAPLPIGWWPPAAGWWAVAAMTLIAIVVPVILHLRNRKRNRYRQQALVCLYAIKQAKHSSNQSPLLKDTMEILKRTFFTAYPSCKNQVARLYGRAWINVLLYTSKKRPPIRHIANELESALYQKDSNMSPENFKQFIDFAELWIKSHRRGNDKTLSGLHSFLADYKSHAHEMEASHV